MAQRISFVDILFVVFIIVACVFELETAPTTQPAEKMADVAVVIDQPCWPSGYDSRKSKYVRQQYKGRELLASLLRELVVNWIGLQEIRVAIIVLKRGTQLEVVKKLDETDMSTVTEQINVRLKMALDDDCEDRTGEKDLIADIVSKNFESISGRRPLASKLTVWIHSFEDSYTPETSMWFLVPESFGRPQVVVLLDQYDRFYWHPSISGLIPATVIDATGKDFSFDQFNQTTGLTNVRLKVENMIDKCSSQRTYDPEKCFYVADKKCRYNVTYGPSPQQGKVGVGYCAKGTVVLEECDKNKCDDECFKQTPKQTKECDAACGEKGIVESRPHPNRVQPEFKHCPWIKTECDGPPCGNEPATKRTRSTTSTETTTSVVRPTASTTAGAEIESWLVAVIITAALVAVALITGTVFALLCSARKRRQRRQSAELPQRRDNRGAPPPPPRMPSRDQRRSPRPPPTSMDTRRPPESMGTCRPTRLQSRDRRRR